MNTPTPKMDTSEFKKITIYPNPKNGEFEAVILFNTQQIGEDYISEEYRWCRPEYTKYCSAMSKDKRASAFQSLCAARVAFATKMGYGPQKSDPKVWFFIGVKNDSEPLKLA